MPHALKIAFLLIVISAGCDNGGIVQSEEAHSWPFSSHNEKILVDGLSFKNSKVEIRVADVSFMTAADDELLKVTVEVSNLDPNKKIHFSGWAPSVHKIASIKPGEEPPLSCIEDEHGNFYMIVPGNGFSGEILPGKPIEDELLFMELVPTAQSLKMTLIGNKYTDGKDLVFVLDRPRSNSGK